MAHLNQRRSQNVNGDFYVDTTCIDCDTCRWMAPEVFYDVDDQSAVYHTNTRDAGNSAFQSWEESGTSDFSHRGFCIHELVFVLLETEIFPSCLQYILVVFYLLQINKLQSLFS